MRSLIYTEKKIVLEYPPTKRTIIAKHRVKLKEKNQYGGPKYAYKTLNYYVQLPYVITGLHKRSRLDWSFYVGFSPKPIKSVDDRLYQPFLPNIGQGLNVCLGSKGVETAFEMKEKTPFELAIFNEHLFWKTVFSGSQNWTGVKLLKKSKLKDYQGWAKLSKENPDLELFNHRWGISLRLLFSGVTTDANTRFQLIAGRRKRRKTLAAKKQKFLTKIQKEVGDV